MREEEKKIGQSGKDYLNGHNWDTSLDSVFQQGRISWARLSAVCDPKEISKENQARRFTV